MKFFWKNSTKCGNFYFIVKILKKKFNFLPNKIFHNFVKLYFFLKELYKKAKFSFEWNFVEEDSTKIWNNGKILMKSTISIKKNVFEERCMRMRKLYQK